MSLEDYTFVSRKLVMYPDLNAHGRLFGGQLMGWIDEGMAQIAARIMGTSNLVTKKFGEVIFSSPGLLGDSVEIWCRTAREGRTSLTLECRVLAGRLDPGPASEEICRSEVVYVALDAAGQPMPWRHAGGQ